MTTVRTPQQVFQHHGEALVAANLDEIVRDYADDAILITAAGVRRGKGEVRAAFAELLAQLPDASWDIKTTIFADDILYLEWAADSRVYRVTDGVDTFVFEDGLITAQTVHLTPVPK